MNRYYQLSDEHRKQLIDLELAIKEQAIKLAPAVKEVVKKYDDKTLSKRLETALKKIDKRLYVHNEWNSFDIKFIEHDKRSIQTSRFTEYVEHNDVYIASTCRQNAYGDSSLTYDNRIIADVVNASIDRNVASAAESIKEVREQLKQVETFRANKRRLEDETKQHNDKINYTIQRYFDLEIKRG